MRATRRVYTATQQERALYQQALAAGAPASGADAGGPDWTTRVMAHPLVDPFKQSRPGGGKTRNPAYLPASAFAAALLDEIIADPTRVTSIETVREAIRQLPDSCPSRRRW